MPLSFTEEAAIDGRTVNVFDEETFMQYHDLLQTNSSIAVKIKTDDGEAILPVRGKLTTKSVMDSKPGVYIGQMYDYYSIPVTEKDKKEYYPGSDRRVDFSDAKSMQELLDKSDKINSIKNQMLESSDSMTQAPLKPDDKPAMRGLKLAINAKGIDLDKYKDRFGENYPNNKRKLADTDITLFQLYRYCECLDMEMDITFRDAAGNIANPMNKVITVNCYPGNNDGNVVIKDISPDSEKE